MKYTLIVVVLAFVFCESSCQTDLNSNNMNTIEQVQSTQTVHSQKRILARGCDPAISLHFSKIAPTLLGNPEYVPTTDDDDFIEKLQAEQWSVIFFAPGACRYSAADQQIPGGNVKTQGWSLDQYKELIKEHQTATIQIVESVTEEGTIELLREALDAAGDVK